MSNSPEDLFSTSEVAAALGVSRITVFRYIKEGKLTATKTGRNYVVTRDAYSVFLLYHWMSMEERAALKRAVLKMADRIHQMQLKTIREQ